ncbi:MAG TPA: hypothetical protein VN366_03340, partial [Feifaniaceae bacterium]|nr:hypothetical protein [Feifaniaceae bacterium]
IIYNNENQMSTMKFPPHFRAFWARIHRPGAAKPPALHAAREAAIMKLYDDVHMGLKKGGNQFGEYWRLF